MPTTPHLQPPTQPPIELGVHAKSPRPPQPTQPPSHQTRRGPSGPQRGWNVALRRGRWLARVIDPRTGDRKGLTFDSKSEAEAWAIQLRAKLQLGQVQLRSTPFEEVAKQYLDDLTRRSRSPLHIATVTAIIETAKRAGIVDLASPLVVPLMTKIMADLKTRHGQPASTKTRNNFLVRMRGVANYAVQRDLLNVNPLVRIAYQKTVKRSKEVFTLDEVGTLVDPAHKDHPFYKAFCCLIYTGFRQREVRFMEWSWFLWDDLRISMVLDKRATATLSAEEQGKVFIPKNGIARRTMLMEELAITMKPKGEMNGPVFPDLRHLDTTAFQRRFDAYVKHCGVTIGDRTPHSTRHTWTCLMLASGENQFMVQEWAGHSQAEMTGHYARQQDAYRTRVRKAGWESGELRLRDFSPGGKHFRAPGPAPVIAMPGR